jgi:hypothetical protein
VTSAPSNADRLGCCRSDPKIRTAHDNAGVQNVSEVGELHARELGERNMLPFIVDQQVIAVAQALYSFLEL